MKKRTSGLNVLQKIRAFFGTDYVVLKYSGGDHEVKPVRWLGNRAFSEPYIPHTAAELLPQGNAEGNSYIIGWYPITNRTFDIYEDEKTN